MSLNLLVLDDDEDQRKDIAAVVRDAQFTGNVVYPTTLEEARTYLATPFDLAIIDLHLGEGLEEAGIGFIRELHSRQSGCKIIAFSNKLDGVLAGRRALAHGACDYVTGRLPRVDWNVLLAHKLALYASLIEASRKPE